jgi:hypothetical protein
MDDPNFDLRSAKGFDRQRASGPFGVDEILPKKMMAWVLETHRHWKETSSPELR